MKRKSCPLLRVCGIPQVLNQMIAGVSRISVLREESDPADSFFEAEKSLPRFSLCFTGLMVLSNVEPLLLKVVFTVFWRSCQNSWPSGWDLQPAHRAGGGCYADTRDSS